MKKMLLLIVVLMLTFNVVFAEKESTNKSPNAFLNYMQGRSAVGFNFMPSFYTLGVNLVLKPLIESISEVENLSSEFSGFGMIFSYEFTATHYLVMALDVGFVNSTFNMSMDGSGVFLFKYSIIPYSFGLKFFTKKNAPWGFYLYPKFGGTIFNATIKASEQAEDIINKTINGHGMYVSLEIGWTIQLFPNMGKDWPVQIGIDIALFDLGYYFRPWGATDIFATSGQSFPSEYKALANIRFLPIPKLGFTIRF